jgi:hypothetical protein
MLVCIKDCHSLVVMGVMNWSLKLRTKFLQMGIYSLDSHFMLHFTLMMTLFMLET